MESAATHNQGRDRCDVRTVTAVAYNCTTSRYRKHLDPQSHCAFVVYVVGTCRLRVMALGWLHLFYAGVFLTIGLVRGCFATVSWVRALARRPPPLAPGSMIRLSRSDLAVAVVGLLAVAAAAFGVVCRPLSTDEVTTHGQLL